MLAQRAVITKDEDFVDMFLLRHQPYKLLLVSTGNMWVACKDWAVASNQRIRYELGHGGDL